ncbi:terpene synthase family protein, partial [Streptomyces katsurahamanus]
LVHPDLPAVEHANACWTRSHLAPAFPADELEAQIQQHIGLWGCYVAPLVTPEVQLLYTEWTTLFFAFDDAITLRESPGHLMRRLLRLMATGELSGAATVLDAAMEDLWGRTTAAFPGPLIRRLTDCTERYLDAVARENVYGHAQALPDMERFLTIRRECVDMRFFLALLEAGMDIALPDTELDGIEHVTLRALEHIALVNDLFSFRKEAYEGECFNVISVIRARDGVPLQEAIDRTCGFIDEAEAAFIAARDEVLRTSPTRDVAVYLDALGYVMAGNQHWSYITPRYHGDGFRWNGVKAGTLTLHPERTVFTHDAGCEDHPVRIIPRASSATSARSREGVRSRSSAC